MSKLKTIIVGSREVGVYLEAIGHEVEYADEFELSATGFHNNRNMGMILAMLENFGMKIVKKEKREIEVRGNKLSANVVTVRKP